VPVGRRGSCRTNVARGAHLERPRTGRPYSHCVIRVVGA